MKADRNIVYDGQNYKEGEEIWDLGSFECIDVEGKYGDVLAVGLMIKAHRKSR